MGHYNRKIHGLRAPSKDDWTIRLKDMNFFYHLYFCTKMK